MAQVMFSGQGWYDQTYTFIPTAKAIVAKDIYTETLSGAPVTVMCDPTTVRSYLLSRCSRTLGRVRFADYEYSATKRIDLDRRGVQMLERPLPGNRSGEMI